MCFISGHDCDIRVIWQYGSWNGTCCCRYRERVCNCRRKSLKEIESEVLKANAKANSEQKPAAWDNDGEAGWAFDDENHWWHSRYQGNPVEGEVNSGLVSASNPIWIQTGFGEAKKIKKITYLSRDNGMGSINAGRTER